MDNPQGRLYWLAGLIDGEGNFGASYSVPSYKDPDKHVIRTYFQIGMTCKEAIDYADEIIKENGIVSTKSYGTRHSIQQRVKWNAKPIYTIRVCGMESIVKMVDLLRERMIVKKEVSGLLREYCLLRLERKGKSRNSPYRTSEIEIIEKIRKLNHNGLRQHKTLRDFTPRLPIEEDKIKSELT